MFSLHFVSCYSQLMKLSASMTSLIRDERANVTLRWQVLLKFIKLLLFCHSMLFFKKIIDTLGWIDDELRLFALFEQLC